MRELKYFRRRSELLGQVTSTYFLLRCSARPVARGKTGNPLPFQARGSPSPVVLVGRTPLGRESSGPRFPG